MFAQLREHFRRKITRERVRQLGEIAVQDETFPGESRYVELIGTSFEKGAEVDEMGHDLMGGLSLGLQVIARVVSILA